jgi:hemolysin activation/secretion protein
MVGGLRDRNSRLRPGVGAATRILTRDAVARLGWRIAAALGVLVVILAEIGASSVAVAQVVPPGALPGRERDTFIERAPPRAVPRGPTVSLPSTVAPPEADKTPLVIRRVIVTGSTVYSTEELAETYRDLVGRRVTLKTVYDIAQSITTKYGNDGYVLTRAVVPPQDFDPKAAAVRIRVVEGFVSKVEWPREKLARYRDFFSHYEAKITAERPANIKTMERYLLLANDLPGLKFTTTLKPAKGETGAATLVVEVTEKPMDVNARIDNRGTKSRGPLQFLVGPTFNNVTGRHEALGISYAGVSPLSELQFVAPTWRHVLNAEGLTAFINGSYAWGYPQTGLPDVIKLRTRSTYIESGASYPVVRSRERNFTLLAMAFMSDNYSFLGLDPNNIDRLRGVRARAEGDFADRFGGVNQLSTTYSQGIVGLGSTTNDSPLKSTPNGRVNFSKIEGFASRTQPLFDRFSAQIAAYAQYAFTSLLVPEQCAYGGRTFGRAFDPSDLLGDHCWMASFELRYDLPALTPLPGATVPLPSVQIYGFTDRGKRYIISPDVGTSATVSAASAGGGIRLGWQNAVSSDLTIAKAVEGPRDAWRFFFVTTARY